MKTYIIQSYFVIDAENEEDANCIASEMQEQAILSQPHRRRKGLRSSLVIKEQEPIVESDVDVVVRQY